MNEDVLALSLAKVDEYEQAMNEFMAGGRLDERFFFCRPLFEFKDGGWENFDGTVEEDIHVNCQCEECTEYVTSYIEDDKISEEDWIKYGEGAYI